MKTITIQALLDAHACRVGVARACDYLGLLGGKTVEDFELEDARELPMGELNKPRELVDYLNVDTLPDVAWALRCVDDVYAIAVELSLDCIASAGASIEACKHLGVNELFIRIAKRKLRGMVEDFCRMVDVAKKVDASEEHCTRDVGVKEAASICWSIALGAVSIADCAGADLPCRYARTIRGEEEIVRQVEHLRQLLSEVKECEPFT